MINLAKVITYLNVKIDFPGFFKQDAMWLNPESFPTKKIDFFIIPATSIKSIDLNLYPGIFSLSSKYDSRV